MRSLLTDIQHIRESCHLILQESKLVASSLGFQRDQKLKRQRRTKTFFGEDRTTAYEHENEDVGFKVNVFNVVLIGHTYPRNQQ